MAYDGEIKLRATLDPSGVKQSARNLSRTIQEIFDASQGKEMNIQFQRAQASMEKLDLSARKLLGRMEELEKTKIPTQEYTEVNNFLEKMQSQYNKLLEKQERYLESGGKKNTSSYRRMESDLEQLNNTIEYSKAELKDLVDSGRAFKLGSETPEYQKLTEQLGDVNNKMRIASESALQNKMFHEETAEVVEQETQDVKKLDKATKEVTKSSKGLNLSFKTILKYGLGIRSLYVLFRRLRSAAKEGLQVMAQQDNGLNERISRLLTTLKQLKADIATIIQPFVSALTPALSVLLDKLHAVAMGLAQFFAALVGQNYIERATVQAMDYADSLEKAAQAEKGLGNYDKLNVISKDQGTKNTMKLTTDTVKYVKEALDNDSWTVKLGKRLHEIFMTAKEALETLWERLNETTWFPALIQKLKELLNNPDALLATIGVVAVGKSLGKLLFKGVSYSGFGANILSLIPTAIAISVTATVGWKIGNAIYESLPDGMKDALGETLYELLGDPENPKSPKEVGGGLIKNIKDLIQTLSEENYAGTIAEKAKPIFSVIYKAQQKVEEDTKKDKETINEIGYANYYGQKAGNAIRKWFSDLFSEEYEVFAPNSAYGVGAYGEVAKNNFEQSIKAWSDFFADGEDFRSGFKKAQKKWLQPLFEDIGEESQESFAEGLTSSTAIGNTTKDLEAEMYEILNGQNDKQFYDKGVKYGNDLNKGIQNSASSSAPKTTTTINEALTNIKNGLNVLAFGESGAEASNLLFTGMSDTATEEVQPTKSLLVQYMDTIRGAVGETDFSETGVKLGNSLFEGLESSISGSVDSATGSFKSIVEQVKEVFGDTAIQSIVTAGNNKLSEVENVGKSVGTSLVSGIKRIFSSNTTLAKTFQELLKKMFKKTYELKFSNVIEGITSTFSSMFSISATVPGLAKGAVIPANKQFLAMLGDQTHGTNIEAPLDTIVEAMRTALSSGGGGAQSVNIYLDGHQISQVVWDNMEKRYKQTGRPVFG